MNLPCKIQNEVDKASPYSIVKEGRQVFVACLSLSAGHGGQTPPHRSSVNKLSL